MATLKVEKHRTAAVLGVGTVASKFAAELASATERTFQEMPIYTIGVHDPSPYAPRVQQQIGQVPGLAGRNISMTTARRARFKAEHPEWLAHDLHEAEIAELHHQLIRTSQHADKHLDTIVWVAESEYVAPCRDLVGRVMRVFNAADLVVVCFLSGKTADPALLDALDSLGTTEKPALKEAGTTTILVDPSAARTLMEPMANGLASLLFAPLHSASNPLFRRVIDRFRGSNSRLTAITVKTSLVPVDLTTRSWWDKLLGRITVSTDVTREHLIAETNSVLMGRNGPTYGDSAHGGPTLGIPSYGNPIPLDPAAQPLALSYLVPFEPHGAAFEALSHQLTDWVGRTYRLPPPSFVASPLRKTIMTDPMTQQAGIPVQVTVLYGVMADQAESAGQASPQVTRDAAPWRAEGR